MVFFTPSKAFSIATTLVIAGVASSMWGVKVYLGVKDVREHIHLLIIISLFHFYFVCRALRIIGLIRRWSLHHPSCA